MMLLLFPALLDRAAAALLRRCSAAQKTRAALSTAMRLVRWIELSRQS
jgi:hypothetical protein